MAVKSEKNSNQKYDKSELLRTGPILKTVFSLGIPVFLSQIVNLFYNIVDRIYIGHIPENGPMALTGLGLSLPIITCISAFSSLFGLGGSPIAGIYLGEGRKDKAECVIGNSFFMLTVFAVILTFLFEIYKKPILYLFGASDATYIYAGEYLSIYLLGSVFVLISLGMNPFIIIQGSSITAMKAVLLGAVFNIILDPVFIFGLKLYVFGAALATIISQMFSSMFILYYLLFRAELRLRKTRPDFRIIVNILKLGISPFIMTVTESLINIAYNTQAFRYGGDLYVGSVTILESIIQMIFVPMNGFTQGAMPLISYNYGAKQYKRVKDSAVSLIGIAFLFSFILSSLAILFPFQAVSIFTPNEELRLISGKMLPIFISGMLVFGAQSGSQTVFMALKKAREAFFFAVFRKVILLIPLVIFLPGILNSVKGIYIAEPVSDTLSAVCCFSVCIYEIKKLK